MNHVLFTMVAASTALLSTVDAHAQTAPTPPPAAEAKAVTPYADLRYRLETVDQAGLPNDATASTLRARIGIKTAEWKGFGAVLEAEAIGQLGNASYNDTVNGKVSYPIIADPTGFTLNQAFVRWKPDPRIELTGGRQAVNLENQRWVGSVNWRQNDQTLDAVRLTVKPAKALGLDYLYAWRVNRVFGPHSPQGIWHDTGIHSVRATYAINGIGTLSAYGLWLDVPSSPALSSQTLGVRIAGEHKLGMGTTLLYAAEYARQQEHGVNPNRFGLDYVLVEPGVRIGGLTLKGGFEQLEGNGIIALQTPLATLHAFNGWADKFLTTPANGLRDFYVDAGYKLTARGPLAGLTLRGAWHDFNSTTGGLNYGSEWDASLSLPVGKHFAVTGKVARYDAAAFATDTTKLWLQIDAKF